MNIANRKPLPTEVNTDDALLKISPSTPYGIRIIFFYESQIWVILKWQRILGLTEQEAPGISFLT